MRARRRAPDALVQCAGTVVIAAALLATVGCSDGDGSATTTPATSPDASADGSAAAGTTSLPEDITPTTLPTTTLPTTTPPTTLPATTLPPTTTTEPLVTVGAVVLVANAAGLPGAAGQLTGQLRGLGFTVAEPTNADGVETRLDVTKVYVLPGAEDVGRSIARLFGGVEVATMPTPVWIEGADEALGDATVVVMLGRDFAEIGVPPR